MSSHLISQRLQQVEAVMREHDHWQTQPPEADAFNSSQPFCLDTLEPLEWLQWVLIPRLYALLESGASLPQSFTVAPYYEVTLPATTQGYAELLRELTQLDALFQEPQA